MTTRKDIIELTGEDPIDMFGPDFQNEMAEFEEKSSVTINYRNCTMPGICWGTDCDGDHCRCHDDCAHNTKNANNKNDRPEE